MRFVIIGSRRTGSSHLVNELHRRPDIFCNGNIFKAEAVQINWPEADQTPTLKRELMALRNTSPETFLELIYSRNYGRPHIGFKIFSGQNDDILNILIENVDVRKIILYRKNVLASYSSGRVAVKTGMWARKTEHGSSTMPKVGFKINHFIDYHNEYVKFYNKLFAKINSTNQFAYFMNYEDINNPLLFRNLINFIRDEKKSEINEIISIFKGEEIGHLKINTSNIIERFSDEEKVRKFLHKNGLDHWAFEGLTSLDEISR